MNSSMHQHCALFKRALPVDKDAQQAVTKQGKCTNHSEGTWPDQKHMTTRCATREMYLVIQFDLGLELCICIWVVQHLSRCILQTPEGNDLGLQVVRAFIESSQSTTCIHPAPQ